MDLQWPFAAAIPTARKNKAKEIFMVLVQTNARSKTRSYAQQTQALHCNALEVLWLEIEQFYANCAKQYQARLYCLAEKKRNSVGKNLLNRIVTSDTCSAAAFKSRRKKGKLLPDT